MGLKDRIFEDFKDAMKSRDDERLSTLKMLKSAIQNKAIETGGELNDEDVRAVLAREARSRRESIEQYEQGDRADLAEKERRELELIQQYLPEPLSDRELEDLVDEVIDETGAEDLSDMGVVMGAIMPKVRGRAEGDRVNELVRGRLS